MSHCIAGSQYIPSIEYFAHWTYHGSIMLEGQEHYQKRTWRNKTAILGPEAPTFLTIPLRRGKNQGMMIGDVGIAYDSPWPDIHLRTLQAAYGKTAYGEEILSGFASILQARHERLWDLNLAILQEVTSMLKGTWDLMFSETYIKTYPEETIDLRKGVPGGIARVEADAQISYPQVHRLGQSHQPNLCIFDLLSHLGPDSTNYLSRYAQKLYDHR